eukprot:gene9384-10364_t
MSIEVNSIMEESVWLEETKLEAVPLQPSAARENRALFDNLQNELNSLKELIRQIKSTGLKDEVERELQTTGELLNEADTFIAEHKANTDDNPPSLTQDIFDDFMNGIADSKYRLRAVCVRERNAMMNDTLPWKSGTRSIVYYAIIAAVFFFLACCYWGVRSYSSPTQEKILDVRLTEVVRHAEMSEVLIPGMQSTVKEELLKVAVEDDHGSNDSNQMLTPDKVFQEANLAANEQQTKHHKDDLPREPENAQTNLPMTNLERVEVAEPPLEDKEAGVKNTFEEKNFSNKPRNINHSLAVNDADSLTEEERLDVNVEGVILPREVVDPSNEHVGVPQSQEEVSLSGEFISANIEGTKGILTTNDENAHHNNNAIRPMNDQSSLTARESEEKSEKELVQGRQSVSSTLFGNQAPASTSDMTNKPSDGTQSSPSSVTRSVADDGCSDEDAQQDQTSLLKAVLSDDLTRLEDQWRCGSRNATQRDENGTSLLHHSVWRNNTTITRFLINHGAEVNAVGQGGKTALHLASHQGYLEVARLLLESGSNVDQVDTDKHTALHYAAHECRKEVAELLIARSADVNAKEQHGQSALFYAINRGCSSVAELLLRSKAVNVDIIDMWGYTALHYATEQNMESVVQSLCERGARKDIFNERGLTALHLAVQNGYMGVIKVLLEAGANINLASLMEGYTPLHMAAKRGDERVVQILLVRRARCDLLDEDLRSAYALAKDAGHGPLLQLFKLCVASAT